MEEKDPNFGSENPSTETIRSSIIHKINIREIDQNNEPIEDENTKSIKSVIVGYKPRVNTSNAYFLQSLSRISASQRDPMQ